MHLSAIVASILIFNEDNTHFLRDVPEVEFVRYFDSVCRPGGVTHFFMSPNAMRSNIDTRSLEPIWTALGEQGVNPAWSKTAKALHDKGIDPYAIWTRRAREKGVSPWLSIRMNDIHEVHDPAFGGLSTMWRNHPEYRIDPKYSGRNWDPYAFSYTNAAVREVYSAYAKELLESYDVDGIEFDWLRFPSLVEKGRGERDAHYITEFMRMARPHVKAAEKRLGHRVMTAARVLSSPELSLYKGLDAIAWAREGLIDMLIVCNAFGTVDFNTPYREWHERISAVNPNVEIMPGLDSGVIKDRRARQYLTLEEYCGFADQMYAQGAPGFYVFNFFHNSETGRTWNAVLDGGLSRDRISNQARTYPVSYRECGPVEIMDSQLPRRLTVPHTVKLYAGDPPKTGHVEVHVAYDREVPLGLAITLNGVSPSSCHAEDGRDWLYPTAIATNAVSYAFPIHAARRGYNEIAFPAEPVRKTVVVAAELQIIPNGGKKR